MDNINKEKICSFCKAKETKNNNIVEGKEHTICKSCIETALCLTEIDDSKLSINEISATKYIVNKPTYYKGILDNFIIGQDKAKKLLSVSVHNHMLRINNPDVKVNKSNILFIGPTGTGKTYLAETISKSLDIPLAIVNTSSLTASGYVGEDTSSILERLWKNAGEDVEKAEKGIIFLDEIDKNTSSSGGTNDKDVSGKAVQQELLKMLEGDIVKIYPEGSKNNKKSGSPIEINTKDILFIAGGAFVGLKDKPGISINALGKSDKETDDISNVRMQELLDNYGIIPEFYGRFNNIVELEHLDVDALEKIMIEPKDSVVKQYKNLFDLSGTKLELTKKFISKVANDALEVKTGARGLKTIMEDILSPIMFDIEKYENKTIKIDCKEDNITIIEC